MASIVGRLLDGRLRMRHLLLMQAVAEHGSLSGAASALSVTQPHVTRTLQELEAAVGSPMFERHSKGVRLTPEGEIFVRYAVSVINTLKLAGERLEEHASGAPTRVVRVGVNLATVHALLPEAILRFKERSPLVTISLVEEYQGALGSMLERNELDMIVARIPSERSAENQYLRLYDDPLVLVVRAGHPAAEGDVPLRDLMGYPWILPAYTSVFRNEIDAFLLAQGLGQPRDLIESSTITATRPILCRIDAMAVLPMSLVVGDPDLVALPVEADTVPRLSESRSAAARSATPSSRTSSRARECRPGVRGLSRNAWLGAVCVNRIPSPFSHWPGLAAWIG